MTTSSENLKAALRRALADVTFDMGHIVVEHPEGSLSNYAARDSETLDSQSLRRMHERATWGDESLRRARSALVRMPKLTRSALAQALRDLLADYVDPASDSVGHAFPMAGDCGSAATFERDGLYTHPEFSSIDRLADALTRGAAVAGSDRVADLVAEWVRGAPMSYRTCTVVPLTLAKRLSPVAGIDMVPLPLSTADLLAALPSRDKRSGARYLGQALVSVDAETTPALFRPAGKSPYGAVRAALTPPVTLETIWEALSLESDSFVDGGLTWDDYGDLSALASQDGGVRGTLGHLRRRGPQMTSLETGVSTLELPDHAVRDLSEESIGRLLRELQHADARTRVAVSRWRTAMNTIRGFADRFIDLRIALESLFLPQQVDQELKFRLAVSGAWLVGEDAANRRRVWDTLRTAYDLASGALHRGDVRENASNAALLKNALSVCRKGILHVLRLGPIADWTDLILDCPREL